MAVPPAWTAPQTDGSADASSVAVQVRLETDRVEGTDWPYGCRWCGASNNRDTVEYCEALEGVVHVECHDSRCSSRACAEILCSVERCDFRDECEDCGEAVCRRHTVSDCLC